MSDRGTRTAGSFAPRLSFWEYVGILRRQWHWLLAALVAIPALAYALGNAQPVRYRAEANVLIAPSAAQEAASSASGNSAPNTRLLTNEINLALGAEVRQAVEAEVGPVDIDDISITAQPGSDVLIFSAVRGNADDAAALANAWARAYVETKQEKSAESIQAAIRDLNGELIELSTQREDTRAPLTALEQQIATTEPGSERDALQSEASFLATNLAPQLGLLDAQINAVANTVTQLELSGRLAGTGSAEVLEPAVAPVEPTNTPLAVLMSLAVIAALLIGFAAATLIDRLDRRLRSAEDVEALGLTVLGTIPTMKNKRREVVALASAEDPDGPVANAYQKVRTSLQFALLNSERITVTITSASAGEGKTSTSTNIAIGLAQAGKNVTIIDGDLRRPKLHGLFTVPMVPGLSEWVRKELKLLPNTSRFLLDKSTSLRVIPAGRDTERPADLVVSEGFEKVLTEVKNESDIVIIDSPPVLPVVDAAAIAQLSDHVILVSRLGTTKKNELRQAREEIERAGSTPLGVILIGDDVENTYYDTYA